MASEFSTKKWEKNRKIAVLQFIDKQDRIDQYSPAFPHHIGIVLQGRRGRIDFYARLASVNI